MFSLNFVLHLLILTFLYFIMGSGFRMYIKLRGTIDFSYVAILMFGAYASVLFNTELGLAPWIAIPSGILVSLPFTLLIVFLSSKLSRVYFSIGTLALYVLAYQTALNLDGITGGALGVYGVDKLIRGETPDQTLQLIATVCGAIVVIVGGALIFLKRTYFYKVLSGWGENAITISALGISTRKYTFWMIAITTFLAVLGGSLYGFYLGFIDPTTFWIQLLSQLIFVAFLSFRFDEIGILLVSALTVFIYEFIRVAKDMSFYQDSILSTWIQGNQLGYFRDGFMLLIIMIAAFFVFRKIHFGRSQ